MDCHLKFPTNKVRRWRISSYWIPACAGMTGVGCRYDS